jgi:hypothetical protein
LGAWERRATDIRSQEQNWLRRKGFDDLPGWTIEQSEVMLPPERDQFAVFTVSPTGELAVRLCFVGKKPPYALEVQASRPLLPAPAVMLR